MNAVLCVAIAVLVVAFHFRIREVERDNARLRGVVTRLTRWGLGVQREIGLLALDTASETMRSNKAALYRAMAETRGAELTTDD